MKDKKDKLGKGFIVLLSVCAFVVFTVVVLFGYDFRKGLYEDEMGLVELDTEVVGGSFVRVKNIKDNEEEIS